VEIALVLALAAVLNLLKVWRMPQGGTVSFVMLPLLVISMRRGLRVALLAGVLYGVLDFLVDPFPPVHWAQYLLDYPLAYGLVGLSGVFAGAWSRAMAAGRTALATWGALLPAAALAAVGRFVAHFASGVVFFGEYAPEGQPVWLYSALYNSYVPICAALAFVGALAVLPVLARVSPARAEADR
jgi:thiamine transporter